MLPSPSKNPPAHASSSLDDPGQTIGARESESVLELGPLHLTEPWPDQLGDTRDISPRRDDPVVEVDLPLFDLGSRDAADAYDPLELDQNRRDSVRVRLIDPRLNAAHSPVRPALSVEEARGPGKLVPLHPRELDTKLRACLSSKRVLASSFLARAVVISCGAVARSDDTRQSAGESDGRPKPAQDTRPGGSPGLA